MSKRKAYPSDLTDAQWKLLEPFVAAKTGGRKCDYERREIVNAIFYVTRTGGSWRMLPHDFPPFNLVHYYFRRWVQDGKRGSARGYDAGKKVKGRKRHLLVDSNGLLLAVKVHGANVQDRDGAKQLLEPLKASDALTRLECIWADGSYAGQLIEWVQTACGWRLDIVKRPEGAIGFQVLPRRWVIERTFAWLNRYRRLSKDYEFETSSSEGMIYLAMIHVMVRRLAH
jgi:putative transposase